MGITIIVRCYRCSGLLLAQEWQKTRMCPYCNSRLELKRADKIAVAENAFDASEILRELKTKRKTNVREP